MYPKNCYQNTVHLRENESISIDPVRIRGIEAHKFVEQDMGYWSHPHGGARMPRIRSKGCIDLSKWTDVSIVLHLEPGKVGKPNRAYPGFPSKEPWMVGQLTARRRMVLMANSSSFV